MADAAALPDWYTALPDAKSSVPMQNQAAPVANQNAVTPIAAPAQAASQALPDWYTSLPDAKSPVPPQNEDAIESQLQSTAAAQKPGLLKGGIDMLNALPAGIVNAGSNVAFGGAQLAANAANKVGLMPDDTYKGIHEGINILKDVKDEDTNTELAGNPVAKGLNVAGDIAGQAGIFAATAGSAPLTAAADATTALPIAGKVAARYLPPVVAGAATAGIQPVQNESDRIGNAIIGAGAGAAGQAAGDLLSTQVTDPTKLAMLKTAEQNDIPVYRNQISDSPIVKVAASAERNIPGSGVGAKMNEQTTAFNQAVNRTLGVDSSTLDSAGQPLGVYGNITGPEALAAADHNIGQTYKAITCKYNLTANGQFNSDLATIEKDGADNLVDSKASAFQQQVNNIKNRIVNATSGQPSGGSGIIPGPVYQNLRSNISGIMRSGNGSPQMGKLLNLLDDQIAKGMVPEDAAAFSTVRGQYRNMLAVEKAIKIAPNEMVTPARIAQAARNTFSDYAYGSPAKLAKLGRLGSSLQDAGANTSKTAVHNQFYDLLKHAGGYALGAGIGGAEGYREDGLGGAAAGAMGGLALNRFGIAPILYSKMSASPSAITQAAPAIASGVTNAFLDRHKQQTGQ